MRVVAEKALLAAIWGTWLTAAETVLGFGDGLTDTPNQRCTNPAVDESPVSSDRGRTEESQETDSAAGGLPTPTRKTRAQRRNERRKQRQTERTEADSARMSDANKISEHARDIEVNVAPAPEVEELCITPSPTAATANPVSAPSVGECATDTAVPGSQACDHAVTDEIPNARIPSGAVLAPTCKTKARRRNERCKQRQTESIIEADSTQMSEDATISKQERDIEQNGPKMAGVDINPSSHSATAKPVSAPIVADCTAEVTAPDSLTHCRRKVTDKMSYVPPGAVRISKCKRKALRRQERRRNERTARTAANVAPKSDSNKFSELARDVGEISVPTPDTEAADMEPSADAATEKPVSAPTVVESGVVGNAAPDSQTPCDHEGANEVPGRHLLASAVPTSTWKTTSQRWNEQHKMQQSVRIAVYVVSMSQDIKISEPLIVRKRAPPAPEVDGNLIVRLAGVVAKREARSNEETFVASGKNASRAIGDERSERPSMLASCGSCFCWIWRKLLRRRRVNHDQVSSCSVTKLVTPSKCETLDHLQSLAYNRSRGGVKIRKQLK